LPFLPFRWFRKRADDGFIGQMALDLELRIGLLAMKHWESGLAA